LRVAALYDFHANVPALEAVLAEVERVSVDRIVIGGDVVPGPLPVETSSDHGRSATGPCFVRGNGDRWVVDTFDTPRSMSEGDERPGRPWAAWTADAIDRRDRDLLASFAGRDTAAWPLVSKHQCGSRDREDAIPTTRRRARAPMCELIVPVKDGQSQRLWGFPLARAEKHVRWQRNGSVGPTPPPPLPFRADEALHQVPGGEASDRLQARPVSEGRPLSAMQGVRAALAAGERGIHGRLSPEVAGGQCGEEAGDGSPVSGAQAPRPRLLGAKASPGSPLPRAEANPAIRYGARGKRRPSPVPPPVVTARGKRVS
jgi:hypothetical protein